ncbi:MAG: ATP-binding cassette domain-containing protein [Bdellovibrionota bacterium]
MPALVEMKELGLVFPARIHRSGTLRDVFVKTLSHPIVTLFAAKQKLEVLSGVDMQIRRGDRIALIGINGAGKTSLCRAIAGFYKPTRGKLYVRGHVRAVFDTVVGIYPELTGRENAEILTDFLYPELDSRAEKIADALEFAELGHFLDTPFKHYSNGMQARLCLSILTMKETDVLILDEVFEGADQFFREKISARVLKMIEASGAVLFVSHNEEQLRRVCNRAIVLRHGKVAFDGPVEEGLDFYGNTNGN